MYAVNPVKEYQKLSDWIVKITDNPISPTQLVKNIRQHLKKSHPVKLKLHHGEKYGLELADFAVGAEYDPIADSNDCPHFYIDIIIAWPRDQALQWSKNDADLLCLELVESLIHEYEHRRQYRNRRYREHKHKYTSLAETKSKKFQEEYLGHPDEIEAYASNIAARLFLLGLDLNTVSDRDSLDLNQYNNIFGKNHPIIQQLLTIIQQKISYLEGSKDGQDYKNSRAGTRL